MKKMTAALVLALALAALVGCGQHSATGSGATAFGSSGTAVISGQGDSDSAERGARVRCRVVSNQDGSLLLAEQGDGLYNGQGIYVLTVGDTPVQAAEESGTWGVSGGELSPGVLVEVAFSGDVLETYPAQFAAVNSLTVLPDGYDNLCSLYLHVLEDLWTVDGGLNEDIQILGVDLSQAPGELTVSERAAIAWCFGQLHGCETVTGTYDELVQQGYIDAEHLQWPDGCLFSIREDHSHDTEQYSKNILFFDAEKWRSGTGAYFFTGCSATPSASGTWDSYQIGSQAIS